MPLSSRLSFSLLVDCWLHVPLTGTERWSRLFAEATGSATSAAAKRARARRMAGRGGTLWFSFRSVVEGRVAIVWSKRQWDIRLSGARSGVGAAIMSRMERSEQRGPVAAPTLRSVIVWFGVGTLAAIVVAVVGGYFVLRSVAIDEAKRQTRTRV